MKKILLATDGSDNAKDAANFLAHLPHDNKIELTVVSAIQLPGAVQDSVVGDLASEALKEETTKAEKAFADIETIFSGANVSLKHVIRSGHAAETIVQAAQDFQPELVVVGAKGHSLVQRVLLGSTSDYVATHAPCSVLVVRPHAIDPAHPLRVAIGFEETGPAQAAIEEFAEFQWGPTTHVRLVSVAYRPQFDDYPFDPPSADPVERAAKQLNSVSPDSDGCVIEHHHIGEGLVRFVEDNDVNLLMVGETPRTRLRRVLMGSKTRFVLRHAPCSVWITRNRMIHGIKKRTNSATEDTAEVEGF